MNNNTDDTEYNGRPIDNHIDEHTEEVYRQLRPHILQISYYLLLWIDGNAAIHRLVCWAKNALEFITCN